MRFTGGLVAIEQAMMKARAPGVIRYVSDTAGAALGADGPGGGSLDLVKSALADFRYRELSLTLDRAGDGQTDLLLTVEGGNPAVLNGYPFRINLRLQGELDRILTRSLAGYRIPDNIRRQIEQFGQ